MIYLSIKSTFPTKTEPTGQARPLEKQTDIESKSFTILEGGCSNEIAALNTLAPSI